MASDPTGQPSLNTQLANAVAELARAEDYLRRMTAQVAEARSKEANAIDKVNEAQRHFDTLVAQVKKAPPGGTDWYRATLATYAERI